MLSFWRDSGYENLSPARPAADAGRTGAGAAQNTAGQPYLTVATRKKSVRRSTIIVGILFCVGLIGLWFMIKQSLPQAASASPAQTEETQIEAAISRLTGTRTEMFSRMDQIVEKFYEFSDVLQVKVNELVKNPFELEMFLSNLMKKLETVDQEAEVDAEVIIQQQIKQKAKGMQLASIMQSDQGTCCMINNKICYTGDLVRGFKVISIGDRCVKLEWQGEGESWPLPSNRLEIELKLSE